MKGTRVLAITAWLACLMLSVALVGHLARAGMDNPIPPLRKAPPVLSPEFPSEVTVVCVVDEHDALISLVTPFPFKPDKADRETFKANLRSAVNLAGRSTGRADVVNASTQLDLIDTAATDPAGCHTVCGCAKPIYCSTAGPVTSGLIDPGTEVMRRRPSPPGGGLCGCGPGCGSCEKCVVVCSG